MLQNQDDLLKELRNNSVVITPNNRLSKQLIKLFADKYMAPNELSIAKPLCLPYQSFLQFLYKNLLNQISDINHPILLNSAQESYAWQQILKSSNHLKNYNYNLLQQIQEAWSRCRLWQIDILDPEFLQTWQGKISQELQIQFQEFLNSTNTISQACLVNYLIQYPILSNTKIIWACFDDFTPAQLLLQKHLQKHNSPSLYFDLPENNLRAVKYKAKDVNDEYEALLIWLTEILQDSNSAATIAIVMPNIETHGDFVAKLINERLKRPVNISLGKSLDKHLLVAHALHFINLHENISNHEARLILNSPYIAGSQIECVRRAELLQNLKILKLPNLKIQDLANECSTLAPTLSAILQEIKPYPSAAAPNVWAEIFQNRLQALGFPGQYSLSSETFQCFTKLQELFNEFTKLYLISPKLEKNAALSALSFLAKQIIFQPKQDASNISILGLLEASGCTFDYIWVTNLTDKCLPNATNFSAFIPINMQKRLVMPHSSNARELQFAKQQLQRLQNSCCNKLNYQYSAKSPAESVKKSNVVFSFPSFVDDIPMLASPLLNAIPEIFNLTSSKEFNQVDLESYTPNYLIPTSAPINSAAIATNSPLPGGTALLANQAKCPFMAFAKHRLFAIPANPVSDWPNNLERGQILHKILEEFWNTMRFQSKLITLNHFEFDNLTTDIIKKIINLNSINNDSALQTLIKQEEIFRYKTLLKTALDWELNRDNFQVVATEKSYTFKLSDFDFKIRVDRLDELDNADKSQIIIDYKSSMPTSKPWDEDRPLEPQLLLYALLDEKVSGILYLEFKNGIVKANGISKSHIKIEGVKALKDEDWQTYKTNWNQQLLDLINEFTNGICTPNPAKTAICQTCDFQNLCRFHLNSKC